MLKIACEYYNANEKTVQFLAKHDLTPIDYSLSKYMIVENADRWIYSIRLKKWAKIDKNNQYSFGTFIDTVDKTKYAERIKECSYLDTDHLIHIFEEVALYLLIH